MLNILQDQIYRGDDWWDWNVWLAGEAADLDAIQEVVWRLHPSFTPSKVTRRNRSEGFRLSTSGWGTFEIKAELILKSGGTEIITHELLLTYPDDEESTPPEKPLSSQNEGGPAIELKVYDNGDHTFLVWLPVNGRTIPDCRGFTIQRTLKPNVRAAAQQTYLHGFIDFRAAIISIRTLRGNFQSSASRGRTTASRLATRCSTRWSQSSDPTRTI